MEMGVETVEMGMRMGMGMGHSIASKASLKELYIHDVSFLLNSPNHEHHFSEGFVNLERLSLHGCRNVLSLNTLELDNMPVLQHLFVDECSHFQRISISANVSRLRVVEITTCAALEQIEFVDWKDLQILNLNRCQSLNRISSFTSLKQLKSLNLSYCSCLEFSLEDLANLPQLQHVRPKWCLHRIQQYRQQHHSGNVLRLSQ